MYLYNLYTIGYASFSEKNFIETLNKYSIGAVVDVRSTPYSKRFELYDANKLQTTLKKNGIYYVFLGNGLGARPTDYTLYTDNRVDFKKVSNSNAFIDGCSRIIFGLEKFNICLLCAEKDPLTCHRTILVTKHFKILHPDVSIYHILANSNLETHQELESRLLSSYKLDSYDLLKTPEMQLNDAYNKKEIEIAYRKNSEHEGYEE